MAMAVTDARRLRRRPSRRRLADVIDMAGSLALIARPWPGRAPLIVVLSRRWSSCPEGTRPATISRTCRSKSASGGGCRLPSPRRTRSAS